MRELHKLINHLKTFSIYMINPYMSIPMHEKPNIINNITSQCGLHVS